MIGIKKPNLIQQKLFWARKCLTIFHELCHQTAMVRYWVLEVCCPVSTAKKLFLEPKVVLRDIEHASAKLWEREISRMAMTTVTIKQPPFIQPYSVPNTVRSTSHHLSSHWNLTSTLWGSFYYFCVCRWGNKGLGGLLDRVSYCFYYLNIRVV